MMKWKAHTETTNIGILKLDNLTFDKDYMEISIDIRDMSDSLEAEVEKAIELRKAEASREQHIGNPSLNSKVWSSDGVFIESSYLRVILQAGKPITYSLVVSFYDAENRLLEDEAIITVDLSEHTAELKKLIIKAMIDRFF